MSLDLLTIFGAGLLTFVTPCVLPLIPIYLSALVGSDFRSLQSDRRGQLVIRASLFSLGFLVVFTLLGLTASSFGAFLADHKAAVQAFGAALILVFGLKFLGVIRIPWLDATLRGNDHQLTTRFGWLNALVMGLVFAAGWSPCVGPVLGSVLTYTATATQSPWAGAGYLAVYGLGFALPLIGLALFAEAGTRLLQRISPHLRKIEFGLGVLLVVVAASMALDALPDLGAIGDKASGPPGQGETGIPYGQPVMLAFTSQNCPICKRMKPILHTITDQCDGNRVRVVSVDLSRPANRNFSRDYRIVGVPTFVFQAADGEEVARLVGEQTEPALKRALSALRGEPCPGLAILDEKGPHVHPADLVPPEQIPQKATCPSPGKQPDKRSAPESTGGQS